MANYYGTKITTGERDGDEDVLGLVVKKCWRLLRPNHAPTSLPARAGGRRLQIHDWLIEGLRRDGDTEPFIYFWDGLPTLDLDSAANFELFILWLAKELKVPVPQQTENGCAAPKI